MSRGRWAGEWTLERRLVFGVVVGVVVCFHLDRFGVVPLAAALGMVPVDVRAAIDRLPVWDGESLRVFGTLLGHAFVHAGFGHVAMNAVFLWVFGTLVAGTAGSGWFGLCFLLTALGGGVGQILLTPDSEAMTVGVSGVVLGLEGTYFALAVRWQLRWVEVWPLARPVPPGNLILFCVFGLLFDLGSMSVGEVGVAYGAHLGGFVTGFFLGSFLIDSVREDALAS